jgi:hypothetical protein
MERLKGRLNIRGGGLKEWRRRVFLSNIVRMVACLLPMTKLKRDRFPGQSERSGSYR